MATHETLPEETSLACPRHFISQVDHSTQSQTLHKEAQGELNEQFGAENETNGLHLPPVDRGRGAWCFLVGASMIHAFVWGQSSLF